MMHVKFRKQAEADLREIVEWTEGVEPEAATKVLADIYHDIDHRSISPDQVPECRTTVFGDW